MNLFGLAGVAILMVTSTVVSGRLFVLWWRTRRLPELLLATGLICTGCLGFAVSMIARKVVNDRPELQHAAAVVALVAEYAGAASMIAFAWRVFHPRARWATTLAAALTAILLAGLFGELGSGQYVHYADSALSSGPWMSLGLGVRALALLWMTIECWRYRVLLQRRLRLGLAEPAVAHRFALWGMAVAATVVAYTIAAVHRAVFASGLQAHPWAMNTVAGLGIISSIGIGLAFFAPEFYRRWVGET